MVIAFPHPPGVGGPGSFQIRFESKLIEQGWRIVYASDSVSPNIVIVVGGTRKLFWLLKMKYAGVPIIHRVDGLAWLHRRKKNGLRNVFDSEVRNYLIKIIQAFFSSKTIYQSFFVAKWWADIAWKKPFGPTMVIYNGVDTQLFKPVSSLTSSKILLCVEGTLDYSPFAIDLLNALQKRLIDYSDYKALVLYGGFEDPENRNRLSPDICYKGKVRREDLPNIYKDAVYLSLDVNAACPNTVIEALSCGIPVIGFDTGALDELVGDAGKVAAYNGDPWKLEFPCVDNLIEAAIVVLDDWCNFSQKARQRAERKYDLELMHRQYLLQIGELLV